MKNLFIVLCFVLGGISITAQNLDTKKADKLFKRYEFVSAVEEYLKLIEKGKADTYVYKQLADTYYNMFNTIESEKWYTKATEVKQDSETYFHYAQMLKANGKYEEAQVQMQKFANASPDDMRAIAFKENPNYITKLLNGVKDYEISLLGINSDKADFGAVLYDNVFYYASARNNSLGRNYGWIGEPYLDIYKAYYNIDGTLSNTIPVTELNSIYHDGPVSINTDGNTIYFSSDSFRDKSFEKDKLNSLKFSKNSLYKASNVNGKWENISLLPFNSLEYSTSNPSLSRDGKTLYFSSNRPGGIGGIDIWKVTVNADGSYGNPENLGDKVNTEGDESFPYIAEDGKTLFFASSGRQGLGGLDVFQIDLSTGSEAINLGNPVNTEKDDFAFTFNESKKIGFVSSNREGNDNIYKVIPICRVTMTLVVTDITTGAILADAKAVIMDDKGNVVTTQITNEKGEINYRLDCDKAYTIQVAKEDYDSTTVAVTKTNEPEVKVDAALQPNKVNLIVEVVNFKTGMLLTDAEVTIINDTKKIIATEMTNENGIVMYKIDRDRAYTVKASKVGFINNSLDVAKSSSPQVRVKIPLKQIDVIVTQTEIILKPIYFEYNKSNITRQGAIELDKLVQVMKNSTDLVIFAKSHTDNRGSDKYNLSLSDRRAKSTAKYIISKGIAANRISGKGFGETEPKVDCGLNCTKNEHSLNRRSEFLIVR